MCYAMEGRRKVLSILCWSVGKFEQDRCQLLERI